MKFTKYFMPFAALAVLASCSNDNLVDQPGENTVPKGETLLAQFEVAIPAANGGTRAEDPSFQGFEGAQSGTEEATVKNVQIFIFKAPEGAESENDYICIGKSEKWSPTPSNSNTDVEKKVSLTVQITAEQAIDLPTNGQSSNKYFGLAVVNNPTENGLTLPTPGVETGTTGVGTKFGDWANSTNAAQSYGFTYKGSAEADAPTYFTMTNAPQWGGEGVSVPAATNIQTLVSLDDSKFAKDPNQPTGAAGTFFVQRGVAKVRLGLASGNSSFNLIPSNVSTTHKVSLTKWDIDITNTSTFPVQVIDGLTWSATYPHQYLAKGTSSAEMGHLWWGKDPNYSSASEDDFTFVEADDLANNVENQSYDYCLENTMAPNQMLQDRTTRVVFKGYYSLSGTFIQNDGPTKGMANSFIVNRNNNQALDIQAYLNESATVNSHSLNEIIASGDWTDTEKLDPTKYVASGATLSKVQAVAILMGLDYTDTSVLSQDNFDLYLNGETYYVARIRHFNNDEAGLPTTWDGNATSYDVPQLGRYGVLRNTIYEVLVKDVKGFGSPTIPDPTEPEDPDPDDPKDPETYNINVEINVLKWAKRAYDYTLD